MTDVVEKSNGQLEEKVEANYANLTDDTGELDYEPSEPDNSIKDVVSEQDEEEQSSRCSTPASVGVDKKPSAKSDDDLEDGEVDELEDGEVKEDEGDDSQHGVGGIGKDNLQRQNELEDGQQTTSSKPKLFATDAQNVKRVSEMLHTGDVRPEDVGICKFYIRGQCTWGNFCKFLHPGVNERGAYQMQYDSNPTNLLNKSVPAPSAMVTVSTKPQQARVPAQQAAQQVPAKADAGAESAWERGLKQAREMMKKANEKKETDLDFEEKRINMPMDTVDADPQDDREQTPSRLDRPGPVRSSDSSNYGRLSPPISRRDPVPLMQEAFVEEFDSGRAPARSGVSDSFGPKMNSERKAPYFQRDPPPQPSFRQQPMMQQQRNFTRSQKYVNPNINLNGSRPSIRDARERIDSQKDRDYGPAYERRQKFDYPQDKGRPLPYERPSYEGKEWRDPWMRSSKHKGAAGGGVGNDYVSGVDRPERGSKNYRRRSYSNSSSSSRSSHSSKSSISSRSGVSSSSASLSSIKSGSSSGEKQPKPKRIGVDKKIVKIEKESFEEKSLPKLYNTQIRSVSPISQDSDSPTEDTQKISVDSEPSTTPTLTATRSPLRKETTQRKPIKMTIVTKSKVQVPVAYEDELNQGRKFAEPSSPGGHSSSTSRDSNPNMNKRKLPPDFEDISPQESDMEDDEPFGDGAPTAAITKAPSIEREDGKTVTSRREELLKQLKAVEDAIAKKRTKPS